MTIRRQYSLPNCTLILEGLTDVATPANQFDFRPILSILMSAECRITGQAQSLSGGRDFFESLVRAVSRYAQEFLSEVPAPEPQELGLVQLQRVEQNLHRLTVQAAEIEKGSQEKPKLAAQVDLTTVQLFDLVEAIDQVLADTQTLPDLTLQLAPLPKRLARATEPTPKRVLPAAIGVSSLALAAMAFFLVPVPEVQRPRDPVPQRNSSGGEQVLPTPSGSGTPNPSPTPTPTGATPSPSATVSPTESTPSPSATVSPMESTPSPSATVSPTESTPSPSPTASPQSSEVIETPVAGPAITDPTELETLNQKLYEEINQAWKNTLSSEQDLVYRVSVAQDGAIIGYKLIEPQGVDESQTPLPQLLYKPVGSRPSGEPLADFRVVFTPAGSLQISPW